MATVKLTKTLRENIESNIRASYEYMIKECVTPQDVRDALKANIESRYDAAMADMNAYVGAMLAHAGSVLPRALYEDQLHQLKGAIAGALSEQYSPSVTASLQCVDNDGHTVEVMRVEWKPDNAGYRYTLPHEMKRDYAVHDEALLRKALPIVERRQALQDQQRQAIAYARDMLGSHSTLKQLMVMWPEVMQFVPQDVQDKYYEPPKPRKPKEKVEPEQKPQVNEDLAANMRNISAQANSLRALKQ